MSGKEESKNKKSNAGVIESDLNNEFIYAYSKTGKNLKYKKGPKYVDGTARGDFSKIMELIDELTKSGIIVIPDTKGDREPVAYSKSGQRIALIGVR